MAQRRMFNKTITNSSVFLKMPSSSRLLYYDLGMNADDDGYVEHYMVLKMTGASQQDLGVLEANGLIKIFDENVLWIKDWKENNYIQKDRYVPSKYLAIYSVDTLCIQDVYTGKNSIGKVSIDNIKSSKFIKPTIEEIDNYCKERKNSVNAMAFYNFYESKNWYVGKNKMKDWKACVRTWEQRQPETQNLPKWIDQTIEADNTSDNELEELKDWFNNYE